MSDFFDKQEREKELRAFDAVWPGDDPQAIIDEFRAAYEEGFGREAPPVESKDGGYTVHFRFSGVQEFTVEQMKKCTELCKVKAKAMKALGETP